MVWQFNRLTVITLALLLFGASCPAQEKSAKANYSAMSPVEQYMMADKNAEIALARSAAPASISGDSEVLVLGRRGYETAVKGKNGFVFFVGRSWIGPKDDPEFWNPTGRAPICFNAAAARSYLKLPLKKTQLILAGRTKAQMFDDITNALEKKELPTIEPGAMCYMLSKQGHLSDRDGHWHPHLMFFVSGTSASLWGANLPGSPIIASENATDRLTVFLVPVAKWSDGTADSAPLH